MNLTFEELEAFVAVVDCGSLTAAAEQLAQTVSAVSRSLGRLECKLETALLQRTTRRMVLTEEGQFFLPRARRILDELTQTAELMALRKQQPAGRLRINAASPFMLHVLVPLIGAFSRTYPQIELDLHSSEQWIDLLEERTDIAIRIGALNDSTLHARAIARYPLRVLASPDYLARHGMPGCVEDLAQHRLLGFTQPESLNFWPLRHGQDERYAITPALRASSGETLRQLALAGEGVVCLADFMTQADQLAGRLCEVLPGQTVPVWQPVHAVYYRQSSLAPRIACFLDFLTQHLPLSAP